MCWIGISASFSLLRVYRPLSLSDFTFILFSTTVSHPSSDRLRACVSKEELTQLLGHNDIQGRKIPILFFANKMDIPGAMVPEMVAEELDLDKVRDKPWHIQSSNALSGDGVNEGIEWLCSQLILLERK